MSDKPPMSFHIDQTISFDGSDRTADVYVKLHVTARTSGLMGDLGPELWQTLSALATFMDVNGYCYPSIGQVAKDLKISTSATQKRLQSLCEFQWKGRPIVTRVSKRHNGGIFSNYRYTILPLSQLSIFDGLVEPPHGVEPHSVQTDPLSVDTTRLDTTLTRTSINKNHKQDKDSDSSSKKSPRKRKSPSKDPETRELASNDILAYFIDKYKEQYGVDYVARFNVEGRLIKTKLLPAYGPDKLIRIIDTVFTMYEHKWASEKYPRPTISGLASWIANSAAAITPDIKEQPSTGGSSSEVDFDAWLEKLHAEEGREY